MKLILWIIGIITVLSAINYMRRESNDHVTAASEVSKLESLNPIINVQRTAINESNKIQLHIIEQQEINRINEFNAQKVKVYVRARDTKTCMKILNIDIINNEVTECNQDHYVEIRNDKLENFKKEQGL